MHVQSLPTQMTQPRPPAFRFNAQDLLSNYDSLSAGSSAPFGGFGVDKESGGYDAAGGFIGMDEWLLRCLELQHMCEFHFEWVRITCSREEPVGSSMEDKEAKSQDPTDWTHSVQSPSALPSVLRRDRELSLESAYTADTWPRSKSYLLGFDHLSRFSTLRQKGHSPRSAARMIIESHLKGTALTPSQISPLLDNSNVNLLQDSPDTDHFSHPALYARSGAIDLILGSDPPEDENAPPDVIPASSAVFSAFGGASYSSDEDTDVSDEELDGASHTNGQRLTMEGRQRARERKVLDFADLYGHVSHDSRNIYGGAYEKSRREDLMRHSLYADSSLNEGEVDERRRPSRPLPTLGSLLATLRACLSFCPRIRVLGLSQFLERAVSGTRECVGLSELRHLSLGPPPPYWSSALHLHQRTLSSVRTLHVAGCMLFKTEAMAIGGYTSALPNLREVDWTLCMEHAVEHPINVIDALTYILGHGDQVTSQGDRDQVKRRKNLKRIHATLHAYDVHLWRQNGRQEIREDPRLSLEECTTYDQDSNIRSVRQWWERKAGLPLAVP
ncbi:hypothetical protein CBS101457_004449 [Exobasidium rhododendri]|nr:hypothetical protein CBS101457_004449 [Exobasidium rhododendri]